VGCVHPGCILAASCNPSSRAGVAYIITDMAAFAESFVHKPVITSIMQPIQATGGE
jgi:hypothetical protein